MKKMVMVVLVLSLVVIIVNPLFSNENSRIITDQAGIKLTIPTVINRIIVFFPQAMGAIFILNLQNKVVGFPNSIMKIEKEKKGGFYHKIAPSLFKTKDIGYPLKPNIETMISLNPDLIIGNAQFMESSEKLRKLGMNVFSIYGGFFSIEEWMNAIKLIAEICNKNERFEKYHKLYLKNLKFVKSKIKNAKKPKVLFIGSWGGKFMIYNSRTRMIYEMIKLCGGSYPQEFNKKKFKNNRRPSGFGKNININGESFLRWNPDIIILSLNKKLLENKPWWKNLKAVKEGKVYSVPKDGKIPWLTSWLSPTYVPLGILWMAKTIHPELFKNLKIEKKAIEFKKEILLK